MFNTTTGDQVGAGVVLSIAAPGETGPRDKMGEVMRKALDLDVLFQRFDEPSTTVEEAVGLVKAAVEIHTRMYLNPSSLGYQPERVPNFLMKVGSNTSGEPDQVRDMARKMLVRHFILYHSHRRWPDFIKFFAENWDGLGAKGEDAKKVCEFATKRWNEAIGFYEKDKKHREQAVNKVRGLVPLMVAAGVWDKLVQEIVVCAIPAMYRRLASISDHPMMPLRLCWSYWPQLPPFRAEWWRIREVKNTAQNQKVGLTLGFDADMYECDMRNITILCETLRRCRGFEGFDSSVYCGQFLLLVEGFKHLHNLTLE